MASKVVTGVVKTTAGGVVPVSQVSSPISHFQSHFHNQHTFHFERLRFDIQSPRPDSCPYSNLPT